MGQQLEHTRHLVAHLTPAHQLESGCSNTQRITHWAKPLFSRRTLSKKTWSASSRCADEDDEADS